MPGSVRMREAAEHSDVEDEECEDWQDDDDDDELYEDSTSEDNNDNEMGVDDAPSSSHAACSQGWTVIDQDKILQLQVGGVRSGPAPWGAAGGPRQGA